MTKPLDEATLEHIAMVARVIGAQSAAALALSECERRRAVGEDVAIFWGRGQGSFIVGPRVRAEKGEAR
jgi:hypothetical protein